MKKEDRISLNEFISIANELKADKKLTQPQQKVLKKLNEGYTLGLNRIHQMNGGDIVWVNPETKKAEYAGRVYKALQHLQWAVRNKRKSITMYVEGLYTHTYNQTL